MASSSFPCCINLRACEKSGAAVEDACGGGTGADWGVSCAMPIALHDPRRIEIRTQQRRDECCINLALIIYPTSNVEYRQLSRRRSHSVTWDENLAQRRGQVLALPPGHSLAVSEPVPTGSELGHIGRPS